MTDAVKALAVGILLVAALVLYPAVRQADRNEDISRKVAEQATRDFVDIVRGKGYIDNRDYDVFVDNLDASGVLYDITLEHYKKRYQPIYGDPNDFNTFTDKYETIYDGHYTQEILNKIYPLNGLPEDHVDRRYNMRVGDLFNLRIMPVGPNMNSRVRSILLRTPDINMGYSYGGMVRNEAP